MTHAKLGQGRADLRMCSVVSIMRRRKNVSTFQDSSVWLGRDASTLGQPASLLLDWSAIRCGLPPLELLLLFVQPDDVVWQSNQKGQDKQQRLVVGVIWLVAELAYRFVS